jgi:branched-chain amino acid transport system ATP-binding protein
MMLLQLKNVTRQFGGLVALNQVNLRLEQGQIVGLIGPNGAGKTTIINNISGLDHPSSGEIFFKDQPIQEASPHRISSLGIARTYQNIRLFGQMSAYENLLIGQHTQGNASLLESLLMLPRHWQQEKAFAANANALLERFDLAHAAKLKAGNLPYGDQRRLEIARALASKPSLLLLDEPTAGMNHTETRLVGEQILALRDEGISVLVIEHDMSLIHQVCDSLYVLNFGSIIAQGSPDEIRHNPDVITAYLGTEESHR